MFQWRKSIQSTSQKYRYGIVRLKELECIFGKLINMMQLKKHWPFLLLSLIVTALNYNLLKIVLQNGFTPEDWWILFDYKMLGYEENFLRKYILALQSASLYHTYQMFYIGILESFFKEDFPTYQLVTIILKILSATSLYPLINTVFKSRLLAFLTSFLYGISYSSAGALYFIVIGSDYAGLLFMNIFLLSYYYYFKKRKKLLLLTSAFLLFISFMLSPIRMYPLLAFVILIEIFVWVKSKKPLGFMPSLKRIILLFLPFLLILMVLPGATAGQTNGPLILYNLISFGNYHLLLPPFAGIGYTLLTNDYWGVFGSATFNNFGDYLLFLIKGPFIIYSILTILIGFLLTKKPLFFTVVIILANIIFQTACFYFVTNLRELQEPNIKYFEIGSIYATYLGFFVTTVGLGSFFLWLKNKQKDTLLLSLSIGPLLSNIFLWGLWLIKGDVLTFKEGIHWYLVSASIGTSLFMATLIVLIFQKLKLIVNPRLKYVLIAILFSAIMPMYLISYKEVNKTFQDLINVGYAASDQERMKNILQAHVNEPLSDNPAIFYFDTEGQKFYPISLLFGFNELMHFRNWEIVAGCTGYIYDKTSLEKSVVVKDGIKGFRINGLCVKNTDAKNKYDVSRLEIFFEPENFHAFKLRGRDVIDIREEMLRELGFAK